MYSRRYPRRRYDRDYDRYYYDREYYYNSQIGRINQNLINYGYMRDVNQIANQYQYMYDLYRRR
jgi:hypothetical protein